MFLGTCLSALTFGKSRTRWPRNTINPVVQYHHSIENLIHTYSVAVTSCWGANPMPGISFSLLPWESAQFLNIALADRVLAASPRALSGFLEQRATHVIRLGNRFLVCLFETGSHVAQVIYWVTGMTLSSCLHLISTGIAFVHHYTRQKIGS